MLQMGPLEEDHAEPIPHDHSCGESERWVRETTTAVNLALRSLEDPSGTASHLRRCSSSIWIHKGTAPHHSVSRNVGSSTPHTTCWCTRVENHFR